MWCVWSLTCYKKSWVSRSSVPTQASPVDCFLWPPIWTLFTHFFMVVWKNLWKMHHSKTYMWFKEWTQLSRTNYSILIALSYHFQSPISSSSMLDWHKVILGSAPFYLYGCGWNSFLTFHSARNLFNLVQALSESCARGQKAPECRFYCFSYSVDHDSIVELLLLL